MGFFYHLLISLARPGNIEFLALPVNISFLNSVSNTQLDKMVRVYLSEYVSLLEDTRTFWFPFKTIRPSRYLGCFLKKMAF